MDEQIDYSGSPATDEGFWKTASVVYPQIKTSLTIRVDSDVLACIKAHGKGYQTEINAVLKSYVTAHR